MQVVCQDRTVIFYPDKCNYQIEDDRHVVAHISVDNIFLAQECNFPIDKDGNQMKSMIVFTSPDNLSPEDNAKVLNSVVEDIRDYIYNFEQHSEMIWDESDYFHSLY